MQIIQPALQSLEVADAVTIGIHIGADGKTIEDAVLVPEVVDHAEAALSVRLGQRPRDKRQGSTGFRANAKQNHRRMGPLSSPGVRRGRRFFEAPALILICAFRVSLESDRL